MGSLMNVYWFGYSYKTCFKGCSYTDDFLFGALPYDGIILKTLTLFSLGQKTHFRLPKGVVFGHILKEITNPQR